jgi:hypothetical protein
MRPRLVIAATLALLAGLTDVTAADLARSVGRIASGAEETGHCSAVFIATDRALTAGHCLGSPTEWRRTSAIGVKVILDGVRLDVGSVALSPRSPFDAAGKIADLGNDWAVLKLGQPMPDLVEPVPLLDAAAARAAALTDDTVVKAGFERGALYLTRECRITALDQAARGFLFRCGEGMGQGLSGSALLVERDDGFGLVGLQTARSGAGPTALGIAVIPPETALRR